MKEYLKPDTKDLMACYKICKGVVGCDKLIVLPAQTKCAWYVAIDTDIKNIRANKGIVFHSALETLLNG